MKKLRTIGVTATSVLIAAGGMLGSAAVPASAATSAVTSPAIAATQAPAVSPTSNLGASINSPDDVARVSALMGRPLSSVRVFLSNIPPSWDAYQLLTSIPANGTVSLSFQSGTNAQLSTFLNSRPPGIKCYVTYFHEPENNFTTTAQKTAYRASWQSYAPAIRAAGCIPTLILMKWSLNPKSGFNWHDWYPDGAVDVLGFDAYNTRAKVGGYGIPANYLAPILAASAEKGLPWALTELGSDVPAGTSPAERAAWAHGVALAATADPNFLFADWWDVLSDTGRNYSLDSATALAWNTVLTAPTAPLAVSATAGLGSAAVTWQAPRDGGSPITGYTVTATNAGTGTTSAVAAGPTATSATVSGLTNGVSYQVSVTATNALGTSPASAPATVVPGTVPAAPSPPVIGVATPGNTTATATWTAPADNGGSSITGYAVSAVNNATHATTATTSVAGTASTAVLTGLTNGQSYTIQVTATNHTGTSAPSAPSNPVTPAAISAAPAIGTATAGNASATATWTAPGTDGGSPITGYALTAVKTSNGAIAATTTVGAPATSGTISGLANGTSYAVRVAAINAIGTSPASALSNTVAPGTVPDIPALGAATGGVKTDSVVSATAWWILPKSNGGSPITGYTVIADRYQGSTVVDSTTSPVQPSTARSLKFPGLVTAAQYRFRVRAINAIGASAYSAPSSPANAY